MPSMIELVSSSSFHDNIKTIGCTGGGAFKYSSDFSDRLDINITKMDEMDCLVRGLYFTLTNVVGECYTYRPEEEDFSDDVPIPTPVSEGMTYTPMYICVCVYVYVCG